MSECLKHDELTKGPSQMWPNFDDFGHFLKVKVAEIFWGARCIRKTFKAMATKRSKTLSKTDPSRRGLPVLLLLLWPSAESC